MADTLQTDKLQDLVKIGDQGFTQGIITSLGIFLAGIKFPGEVKKFEPPNIEREVFEHAGQFSSEIPLDMLKKVLIEFTMFSNHPAILNVLALSPSFALYSTKTRMALMQNQQHYQDRWDIIAKYKGRKLQTQEYKGSDEVDIFYSVHTMQHRWGDGTDTYELGYYKLQPPEARESGVTISGARYDDNLIQG